ncbi:MAG TPA: alpha/beta hydrolase [Cytophagaceae bacterium]|jgi:predicted esterase
MQTHHLSIEKTAKVCTVGDLNKDTKAIWIVCHGYGQLAQFFAPKFSLLASEGHFIIAPEALSRFYLQGFSGRVGAAWMSREERDCDIEDNINYLNTIYAHFDIEAQSKPLNVLGFSQGVATACRWLAQTKISFQNLVLWAGIFPPDMNTDFEFSMDSFEDKKVFIVYGDNDPFLKVEHEEEVDRLSKKYKNIEVIRFSGKHEISPAAMEILLGKLAQPL